MRAHQPGSTPIDIPETVPSPAYTPAPTPAPERAPTKVPEKVPEKVIARMIPGHFSFLSAVSPKSDQVWISQALDLASKVSKPSAETHDGKYHI